MKTMLISQDFPGTTAAQKQVPKHKGDISILKIAHAKHCSTNKTHWESRKVSEEFMHHHTNQKYLEQALCFI